MPHAGGKQWEMEQRAQQSKILWPYRNPGTGTGGCEKVKGTACAAREVLEMWFCKAAK